MINSVGLPIQKLTINVTKQAMATLTCLATNYKSNFIQNFKNPHLYGMSC